MRPQVLITGGCGFIGRHVAAELLEHGYRVRLIDSLVDQVHGGMDPPIDPRAELVRGDLRQAALLRQALEGNEMVVHLAAEVGVGQSMYEIARYVGGNDLATAVLLEEMIDFKVRRVVVASSMSVYGEGLYMDGHGRLHGHARRHAERMGPGKWDPLDEDGQPLTPVPTDEAKPIDLASIYSLTKYVQERAVMIFAEAYRREAVALRLFNVYGPGQALSNPYTGVLANFASRLLAGEPPLIFEDGRQRRDFVHVRDVARAFRLALEKEPASGQVLNIGSGVSWSIGEIARLLGQAMNLEHLQPEILNKARAGDIRHCFADLTKAQEVLGYEPLFQLEESLTELVQWVRSATAVDQAEQMRRELESRGLVQ